MQLFLSVLVLLNLKPQLLSQCLSLGVLGIQAKLFLLNRLEFRLKF